MSCLAFQIAVERSLFERLCFHLTSITPEFQERAVGFADWKKEMVVFHEQRAEVMRSVFSIVTCLKALNGLRKAIGLQLAGRSVNVVDKILQC